MTRDLNHGARRWKWAALVLVLALAMLAMPVRAVAAPTPDQDINSAGPLTDIWIGNDLSCQIAYSGDSDDEFYPPSSAGPADCGTFLAFGGNVYGPDFANHADSATGKFDTPYTATSQSGVTGAGTSASPFAVTTSVTAGATGLGITQVDSYVVADEYYRTDITVTNSGPSPVSALLYRAGDCYLQNSDEGYGYVDARDNSPGCTANPNDSPAGQIEQFAPVSGTVNYLETDFSGVWSALAAGTDLPDTCDCTTFEDNGEAINWDITVPANGSVTYSQVTNFSASGQVVITPTVTTEPATGVTTAAATLNGTVNPQGTTVNSCVFDWGTTAAYGQTTPCAQPIGSGSSAVAVSAALGGLSPATTYHFRVEVAGTNGTSDGLDQTFTTAPTPPPPPATAPAVTTSAPQVTASSAMFTDTVNPEGSATTAQYEYGLDPKYSGGGPIVYDLATPTVAVGSGSAPVPVSQSVTGLVPNAVYHVRLVASNSAGSTTGPDQEFTTARLPNPPSPTLGRTENVVPISGLVFVKLASGTRSRIAAGIVKGEGFIPLTQARQVPVGSQVDARRGTLDLVVATPKRRHSNTARLSGGVFSLAQERSGRTKGLSTLALLENAFPGGPAYSSCTTAEKGKSVLAEIARLSPKVLQTLSVTDNHGTFRTTGRYSAATERGTSWETEDRCDGTLTIVKRGSVNVEDFRTRKTIVLHAGHSFLASAAVAIGKPPKHKKKKK